MIALFIVAALVVFVSALCSGTEAALFSISEVKVRAKAEHGNKMAQDLLTIQENMTRPIAAIVILNNIANISGSMLTGKLAAEHLGTWEGIFVGAFTFAIIICSEIIPKTFGERYTDPISFYVAKPVLFLTWCFTPLLYCVSVITHPFTREDSKTPSTDENEIRMMANIGSQEGAIKVNESILISKVLEMDEVTAADIMTPRVMMTCLDQNATLEEAREDIVNSTHSRIIMIDDEPDNVTGVLYKNELLIAMVNGEWQKKVANYSHKVNFTPEQASADKLLRFFQASRQHLSVVTDQYSGIAGVVSLEDVLEVLTGEIVDETDEVVDLQKVARDKSRTQTLRKEA